MMSGTKALVSICSVLLVLTLVNGSTNNGDVPVERKDSKTQNVGDKTVQAGVVKSSTSKKASKEDENSSGEADKKGGTSWLDSLNQMIEQTKKQVNDHIAALTTSAQQASNDMAGQAMGLVQSAKDKTNNRWLLGRVYSSLSRASENQHLTIDEMVNAFAVAISAELHSWMPTHVDLPGLEMKVGLKYMCGAGGKISNLQTMAFTKSRYSEVSMEDTTISAVFTYSFQYLHMTYDHFGESTLMTSPVVGNLDLGFYDNEVEFELDIPNVSVLAATKFNPECLISVKNFTVTRLAVPQANIEPASAFRTYAQQMVDKFSTRHEEEFRNLFRLGVVQSLGDLLKSSNKWICKTEKLDKIFEVDDKNVMKPQHPEKYQKYCGEVAQFSQFLHNTAQDNGQQTGNVEKSEKNKKQAQKE